MTCLENANTYNISRKAIQQLLVDQYVCTEEYCNATTALHNTVLDKRWSKLQKINVYGDVDHEVNLKPVIGRFHRSLQNIQNNFCALTVMESNIRKMKEGKYEKDQGATYKSTVSFVELVNLHVFEEHVLRTRRILNTIYIAGEGTSFQTNGITLPKPENINPGMVNIKLVALSTLRASINAVIETLPP